mmetsp:Transcript_48407/g.140228  ORF Transcript_48407/g.140228 Transcript_48407/m.140228 type:complete len:93 (-) Transcript_48407:28-306(-)
MCARSVRAPEHNAWWFDQAAKEDLVPAREVLLTTIMALSGEDKDCPGCLSPWHCTPMWLFMGRHPGPRSDLHTYKQQKDIGTTDDERCNRRD